MLNFDLIHKLEVWQSKGHEACSQMPLTNPLKWLQPHALYPVPASSPLLALVNLFDNCNLS